MVCGTPREVSVSVTVEATGRVTGPPSRVSSEGGVLAVFVLDPYPGAAGGTAHACEVRCRDDQLIREVLRQATVGARVMVSGKLTMSMTSGPMEDDLCAVRVGIEADRLCFESVGEPRA
jgi:hypothetical protein